MGKAPGAQLRVGELARRCGVSTELLRTWERRYGVLAPRRSDGGYRLYSELDERRVRRIRALLAEGLSTAEAAKRALAEMPLGPVDGDRPAVARGDVPMPAEALEQLLDRLLRFDESEAQGLLDRFLTTLSLDTAIEAVILPALRELGRRWEVGEVSVSQEHFASGVIQGRLLALGRGWDQGLGPRALLACPSGERHELGLASFGLALHARGWRVTYLGADTPIATLQESADTLGPEEVILSASAARVFTSAEAEIRLLGARHPLVIGGAGASAALARRLNARFLGERLIAVADRLTDERVGARSRGGGRR